MRVMGDDGIPDGYTRMNGHAVHTFKWVNHSG